MKILYGTGNKNKLEAMRKIIKNYGLDAELFTTKDIGFLQDIEETGTTFEENSEIKALAIKEYCNVNNIKDKIIITDDAGLCVDVLNGEPGVYTGRYAGKNPTPIENITKLLNNMKNYTKMEDRTCKFVCVLTAILPTGEKIVARGECKGKIALEYKKIGGLTYEALFIPEGFDKPMIEMEEKDYVSVHNHRYIATIKILQRLKELGY